MLLPLYSIQYTLTIRYTVFSIQRLCEIWAGSLSLGRRKRGIKFKSLHRQIWKPAWPNGYGVGLLNRRLGIRVPPWVNIFCYFRKIDQEETLQFQLLILLLTFYLLAPMYNVLLYLHVPCKDLIYRKRFQKFKLRTNRKYSKILKRSFKRRK